MLKNRYTYSEGDSVNLKVFTITPAETAAVVDRFLIRVRTPFDIVEEEIAVGQKPAEMRTAVEQMTWETLQLRMKRAAEDRELAAAKTIDQRTKRIDTAYRRAMWDIGYKQTGTLLDTALDLGGTIASGISSAYGYVSGGLSNLMSRWTSPKERALAIFGPTSSSLVPNGY